MKSQYTTSDQENRKRTGLQPEIRPEDPAPEEAIAYRPDLPEVARNMKRWWEGRLDRPALRILGPRCEPVEPVESPEKPETGARTDMDYQLKAALASVSSAFFWGDAVPTFSCDVAPEMVALFLGCTATDTPETLWVHPCMDDAPEDFSFEIDEDNFYFQWMLQLAKEVRRLYGKKFRPMFPQFDCGLDTLAALRGTESLLYDFMDRPEWVRDATMKIAELCVDLYEMFYPICRYPTGGTTNIAFAPDGIMARLQCDFSAMLSPEMFRETMVPAIEFICDQYPYTAYHWDGPGALKHHDELLGIDNLKMLQFTPGAGNEPEPHSQWWPYYHRTLEAGKKMHIRCWELEELRAVKEEFGKDFRNCYIVFHADDEEEGRQAIDLVVEG